MSLPNNNKKSKSKSGIAAEIKFYRDRHKREGIVPKYQEPRSVTMPDEPSPKAKNYLNKVKKFIFYRGYNGQETMRDLRMLRLRLRRVFLRLPS